MKAVGFDADGVLIASREMSWRSAERVLAPFGVTASIDSPQAMEALFGHSAQHALVGQEHAAVLRMMHRLLMRQAAQTLTRFDDVLAVVAALQAPRILVTAALADGITTCLGPHARHFDDIIGFERGRKHDLLAALADGISLYVTDTAGDVEICRDVGIPAVACTWGSYDTRETLVAARPEAIVESSGQLSAYLNTFLHQQGNQ